MLSLSNGLGASLQVAEQTSFADMQEGQRTAAEVLKMEMNSDWEKIKFEQHLATRDQLLRMQIHVFSDATEQTKKMEF
jgi:hypothetical protein